MGVDVWGIFSGWISRPYFKCFLISEAFHIAYSPLLLYVSSWNHHLKRLEFFLTANPTTTHAHVCTQSLFHFCDQKIPLKYSPKSLKGSHCLLSPWFFSGRKPQVALTVSVVLLYCKTALNYNLFSTFIAGLLVIWFPKLCLFNVWFGHYFSNSYLTFTLASFHFFFLIYNLLKVVWWELFSWELEVTPRW